MRTDHPWFITTLGLSHEKLCPYFQISSSEVREHFGAGALIVTLNTRHTVINESSIQYVVAVIKVVLVEVLLKLLFLPECSVFVGRSSSAIWQGLSGPRPSTPPPPAFRFLANRSQDLAARSSSALAASLSITFLRLKPILWT